MVTQNSFCTMKGSFIKYFSSGEVTSGKIILLGKKVKANKEHFIIRRIRVSHSSDKTMQLKFIGTPGTGNDQINEPKSKDN